MQRSDTCSSRPNLFEAVELLRVPGGHCDGAEEAESHGPLCDGVVTWRAADAEASWRDAISRAALHHCVHQRHRRSRRLFSQIRSLNSNSNSTLDLDLDWDWDLETVKRYQTVWSHPWVTAQMPRSASVHCSALLCNASIRICDMDTTPILLLCPLSVFYCPKAPRRAQLDTIDWVHAQMMQCKFWLDACCKLLSQLQKMGPCTADIMQCVAPGAQ